MGACGIPQVSGMDNGTCESLADTHQRSLAVSECRSRYSPVPEQVVIWLRQGAIQRPASLLSSFARHVAEYNKSDTSSDLQLAAP